MLYAYVPTYHPTIWGVNKIEKILLNLFCSIYSLYFTSSSHFERDVISKFHLNLKQLIPIFSIFYTIFNRRKVKLFEFKHMSQT